MDNNKSELNVLEELITCLEELKTSETFVDASDKRPEIIENVQDLLVGISANDKAQVQSSLMALGVTFQPELFDEVGKLTRKLHNALMEFRQFIGPRISRLANSGVPQATDNLQQVIEMTNKAAHKVIEIAEEQSALMFQQNKTTSELAEISDVSAESSKKIEQIIEEMKSRNQKISSLNTEIIMAQEFQDLSGQILQRVINLITEVEDSLVDLVRMFSMPELEEQIRAAGQAEQPPCQDEDNSPSSDCSQDDIDGLLGSLGF